MNYLEILYPYLHSISAKINIASGYGRTCYYYAKLICLPLSWAPVSQILPTKQEIENNTTDDQTITINLAEFPMQVRSSEIKEKYGYIFFRTKNHIGMLEWIRKREIRALKGLLQSKNEKKIKILNQYVDEKGIANLIIVYSDFGLPKEIALKSPHYMRLEKMVRFSNNYMPLIYLNSLWVLWVLAQKEISRSKWNRSHPLFEQHVLVGSHLNAFRKTLDPMLEKVLLTYNPPPQIKPSIWSIKQFYAPRVNHCGIKANDILDDWVNGGVLLDWREDRITFTDSCSYIPKPPYPFLGSGTCPSIGEVSQSMTFHMDELLLRTNKYVNKETIASRHPKFCIINFIIIILYPGALMILSKDKVPYRYVLRFQILFSWGMVMVALFGKFLNWYAPLI